MNNFTIKKPLFLVSSKHVNEELEKLVKFLNILEKSGIEKIIKQENKNKKETNFGRKGYNKFNLMATIIYCFAMHENSLRNIEDLCKYDLRVIHLMEQKTPDYTVVGDFINKYILPYQYEIFSKITKTIIEELNLDVSNQYIDGSKFEANANKYKFVWKPTTFHKKLDTKIKSLLLEMGLEFSEKNLIKSYTFNNLLKEYVNREHIVISDIPSGKGKRLTQIQKNYKIAYKYLIKLLEYEEKEKICGKNRNSYYKTDQDATAMVLKSDYYSRMGHNFHAGYNVQVSVSNGIITMYGVFQDRSDYYTFVPMLTKYYKYYKKYPKNIAADSGYGIYTNYKFLQENGIGNYVKFLQWSGESSGKNPQLFFVSDDEIVTCLNNKVGVQIPFEKIKQRNKDGKLYIFKGCKNCKYSYVCKKRLKKKTENFRKIEIIIDYEKLKNQTRFNLLSPKGIEMRINRSIQVEGAFGQLKQNMKYVRIRRREIERVSCEIMLMCLGRNVRKIFSVFSGNEIKSNYWTAPTDLTEQIFPKIKPK